MAFDFKKEYKEFYLPPKKPVLLTVPPMQFVAVRGTGDPNAENGAYQHAMQLLYGIAFTVKMSKMTDHRIPGYFDFTVPPLEGLWQQDGSTDGMIDNTRKDAFQWISMIRLPDFVTAEEFEWARQEASGKKKMDFSAAEFFSYHEGLCVQCMHIGSYDTEHETVSKMQGYMQDHGLISDDSMNRRHHEIYLSDPRKTAPEKLKTVIRLPVVRQETK
ncbi:MAG: GyrI-like domain-containing protein [Oscillospiraceae bacterium]|nr:GyrI-like domain-containing protein [Oscillospiraceae bacterium]